MTTTTNRLRAVRADARVMEQRRPTQLWLSMQTKIHPTRLWRIENGVIEATPEERHQIATALRVPESVIWPGIERETEPVR